MANLTRLLLAVALAGWAQIGLAQQMGLPAAASKVVLIQQAREANAALMHHYLWNSRTEIIVKGEVKDIRIEQVSYGPTGQLQRQLLNDQPAAGDSSGPMLPLGFLIKKAIAEQEKQELQQFLTGLKGLLEQYTLPTAGKMLDFISSATPTMPDASGLVQLSGFNVVQPGDNLRMWINAWTRHETRMQVNTSFQGAAVQVNANFATLPQSGLNYVAFAEATVPAKQLSVQVQNYNYARLAY